MRGRVLAAAMAAFLGGLAAAGPARADSIDGDWCSSAGGRFLSIQGPRIMTPGGTRMEGNYSRHAFDYVAPSGDPEAGRKIDMVLVNEETVHLRLADAAQASPQVWRRCKRPVS